MASVRVYATEADPHRKPALGRDDLWANLVLHALFFDEVLLGDAQALTNPVLRDLVVATDGDSPGRPGPLTPLIGRHVVRPALRSNVDSLQDLGEEQHRRGVRNAPPRWYVDRLLELIAGDQPRYEEELVSGLFKERVLDALEVEPTGSGRLGAYTKAALAGFVRSQDTLLYDSCRKWMRARHDEDRLSRREIERIERILRDSYSDNVPIAMQVTFDRYDERLARFAARRHPRQLVQRLPGGVDVDARLAVLLSHDVLGQMTPDVLLAIRDVDSRRPAISMLEDLQRGDAVDHRTLADRLNTYVADVELVVMSTSRGALRDVYLRHRRTAVQAVLKTISVGTGMTLVAFMVDPSQVAGLVGGAATFVSLIKVVLDANRQVLDFDDRFREGFVSHATSSRREDVLGLIHGGTIYDWTTREWESETDLAGPPNQ